MKFVREIALTLTFANRSFVEPWRPCWCSQLTGSGCDAIAGPFEAAAEEKTSGFRQWSGDNGRLSTPTGEGLAAKIERAKRVFRIWNFEWDHAPADLTAGDFFSSSSFFSSFFFVCFVIGTNASSGERTSPRNVRSNVFRARVNSRPEAEMTRGQIG